MAWRFRNGKYFKGGTLDNTVAGMTSGYIHFAGAEKVDEYLSGNMSDALRGKLICFSNPDYTPEYFEMADGRMEMASDYMESFANPQVGIVGRIALDPHLYIEWHSSGNGRCVIELDQKYLKIE